MTYAFTNFTACGLTLAALCLHCGEGERRPMCEGGVEPRRSVRLVCNELEECEEVQNDEYSCPNECQPGERCDTQCPALPAPVLTDSGEPVAAHVVDGSFTGEEWAHVVPQEGVMTDLYLDYADGHLYLLNDWRANTEGIRPDCFNHFQFTLEDTKVTMKVYGNGRVEVLLNDEPNPEVGQGMYGFGPSPLNPTPHTMFELSLELDVDVANVCCTDPVSLSTCEIMQREPVSFTIDARGARPRVGRFVPERVVQLSEGAPCGTGETGVCSEGLRCQRVGAGRACIG
ncbi:MAG: hypothetical protein AAF645_14530 [Myxococcota bacterium]